MGRASVVAPVVHSAAQIGGGESHKAGFVVAMRFPRPFPVWVALSAKGRGNRIGQRPGSFNPPRLSDCILKVIYGLEKLFTHSRVVRTQARPFARAPRPGVIKFTFQPSQGGQGAA